MNKVAVYLVVIAAIIVCCESMFVGVCSYDCKIKISDNAHVEEGVLLPCRGNSFVENSTAPWMVLRNKFSSDTIDYEGGDEDDSGDMAQIVDVEIAMMCFQTRNNPDLTFGFFEEPSGELYQLVDGVTTSYEVEGYEHGLFLCDYNEPDDMDNLGDYKIERDTSKSAIYRDNDYGYCQAITPTFWSIAPKIDVGTEWNNFRRFGNFNGHTTWLYFSGPDNYIYPYVDTAATPEDVEICNMKSDHIMGYSNPSTSSIQIRRNEILLRSEFDHLSTETEVAFSTTLTIGASATIPSYVPVTLSTELSVSTSTSLSQTRTVESYVENSKEHEITLSIRPENEVSISKATRICTISSLAKIYFDKLQTTYGLISHTKQTVEEFLEFSGGVVA